MQISHLPATARIGALVILLLAPFGAATGQGASPADLALDSLLNTRISAASKYAQTAAQAPASVTILTSDELRNGSFRDLQEALESVRGFYFTDDKNYPYLGTRGFSRPSDYNNRILVLVDGHALNEQVWGGTPVGVDLPISLEGIERIEIVRGPGSTVYGSSAMFGVINIVTRRGQDIGGVIVSGRVASKGLRMGELTAGRAFGGQGSMAFTALTSKAVGQRTTYAEYPGIVSALDAESKSSALASFAWRNASARTGYRVRTKAITTGSYETDPSDPRSRTRDENLWLDVGTQFAISAGLHVNTRVFADRYRYHGTYANETANPFKDKGVSTALGTETVFVLEPASSYRLTTGVELRRVFRAEYEERNSDGNTVKDDAPFSAAGIFAENELQLGRALSLVAGARVDYRERFDAALSPRVALIGHPRERTTLKLLYGQAFRAPSPVEAELSTGFYETNLELKPERIQTFELELRERLGNSAQIEASLYHYSLSDLISAVDQETDGIRFRNNDSARGSGAEIQADVGFAGPFSGRFGYAYQQAHDAGSGASMYNSPAHVATASMVARPSSGWRSSVVLRHESGRATVAGPWTSQFTRTDFHVSFAPRGRGPATGMRGARVAVALTNAFNVDVMTPAGYGTRQTSFRQPGRTASVQLDWRF